MSKFTPISKARIKKLEVISTSYLNTISRDNKYDDPMIIHNFHNWSDDAPSERANLKGIFYKGLYEKVRYISNKRQAYYVNYSGLRNAVWGFKWNGNEYLVYYSNEGLTLQMLYDVSGDEVLAVIGEIIKKWRT